MTKRNGEASVDVGTMTREQMAEYIASLRGENDKLRKRAGEDFSATVCRDEAPTKQRETGGGVIRVSHADMYAWSARKKAPYRSGFNITAQFALWLLGDTDEGTDARHQIIDLATALMAGDTEIPLKTK